ncbi:MAG TPA: hypothetical protein VHZ50_00955 [Puia sp.]|nr:hypothetical protein [Puia sp.]
MEDESAECLNYILQEIGEEKMPAFAGMTATPELILELLLLIISYAFVVIRAKAGIFHVNDFPAATIFSKSVFP